MIVARISRDFFWTSIQTRKHLAYELSVMPFFVFDLFDSPAFFLVCEGLPVSTLSVGCRAFPGIGELQNTDQLVATVLS